METTESLKKEISNLLQLNFKYPCDQCDYTAFKAKYIRTHVKSVHLNIKKPAKKQYSIEKHYYCEHCEFKTIHKSSLKTHTEAIHENVVWHCDNVIIMSQEDQLYMNIAKEFIKA